MLSAVSTDPLPVLKFEKAAAKAMEFRKFCAQHNEMASVAQAILDHVTALDGAEVHDGHDPLPALRLTLSREVADHCSLEIDVLRKRLKSHPQVAVDKADIVRRYHDELLAWRGSLVQCNADWPAKSVNQNPSGFLEAFRPIADALFARIRWEEGEFYPKVLGRSVARR